MKINAKGKSEFDKFTNTLDRLLAVPHSKIKAMAEEEKATKKRKKPKQSCVSAREKDGRV